MTRAGSSPLLSALDRLAEPSILVLGDVILDRYTWGDAQRVSQEAPVIVLRADSREERLGGAANVGVMLRALGARVACAGVVGHDDAARSVRTLCDEAGIDHTWLLADSARPTTTKERFVGRAATRHPNQILRVDHEVTSPLSSELESTLCGPCLEEIQTYDAILISDYDKGVCTPALVERVIRAARQHHIPVLVDPGRGVDLNVYRGATVIKPNRSETESVCGAAVDGADAALRIGSALCRQFDAAHCVITLDREGMVLTSPDADQGTWYPTRPRAVYDITGAGDTVLATLGVCWASGLSAELSVQLANLAGGIEVERVGVSPVSRDDLRQEIARLTPGSENKIVSLDEAVDRLGPERRQQRTVVFTNGCFDLLHVGHVSYLAEAAALGDRLVVGVNSDASVRRLKGPSRPVIKQQDRAAMLAALECVDLVIVFDEPTPHRLLEAIRPDVLVKGGTYQPHEVVGHEVVERYGGRVCVTSIVEGISTSHIVAAVRHDAA